MTTTCCKTDCPNKPAPIPTFQPGDRVIVARPIFALDHKGMLATVRDTVFDDAFGTETVRVTHENGYKTSWEARKLDLAPAESYCLLDNEGDWWVSENGDLFDVIEEGFDDYEFDTTVAEIIEYHGIDDGAPTFAVGDYVRVTAAREVTCYTGKEGEITAVGLGLRGDHVSANIDGRSDVWLSPRGNKLEHAERPQKFKVGDYVRIVGANTASYRGQTGEISRFDSVGTREFVWVKADRDDAPRPELDVWVDNIEHAELPPLPLEPYAYVTGLEALEALPNGSVIATTRGGDGCAMGRPIEKRGNMWLAHGSRREGKTWGFDTAELNKVLDGPYGFLLLHHG